MWKPSTSAWNYCSKLGTHQDVLIRCAGHYKGFFSEDAITKVTVWTNTHTHTTSISQCIAVSQSVTINCFHSSSTGKTVGICMKLNNVNFGELLNWRLQENFSCSACVQSGNITDYCHSLLIIAYYKKATKMSMYNCFIYHRINFMTVRYSSHFPSTNRLHRVLSYTPQLLQQPGVLRWKKRLKTVDCTNTIQQLQCTNLHVTKCVCRLFNGPISLTN